MKKVLFIVTMAAIAAVGCGQADPDNPAETGYVKIEPLITRATSTNFEQGDQIGLTIVKADATEHASNACLTYDEAAKAFSGDTKWYAEGGDACSLKAFYPYQAAGFPESFTVALDQTNGAGASDFMAASKTGVLPQREAVAMVFKHYLSQIVVNVTNSADAAIEYIAIKNLVPTAEIAVEGDDITVTAAEGDAAVIKAECLKANQKYRAVVVPQTKALAVEIKVDGGNVLVTSIIESELKQGFTYTVNAEVTPDNVNASISGEIANWEDGGTLTEDQEGGTDDGGTPGVSFHEYLDEGYFEYDNVKYTVEKFSNGRIWMTQPLRFVPAGITVSSDATVDNHVWYSVPASQDGGAASAKNEKYGLLYDYYAIFDTKDINEENYDSFEGAQGICPKGWHVPTKAEAESLVAAADTALFYDGSLKYATIAKANAAGFNYVSSGTRNKTSLTGNGSYLTTTVDEEKAGDLTDFIGECSMNYIALSTGYQCKKDSKTGAITNYQYYGIMSTFSKTLHGKLNTAYTNVLSGYQVRCVRDAKK